MSVAYTQEKEGSQLAGDVFSDGLRVSGHKIVCLLLRFPHEAQAYACYLSCF